MGAKRILTAVFCLALAALPLAAPAWATDYWIDGVAGYDSNDGLSRATAWKTLGKANPIVVAGDTVHVLAGVYRQQAIWPTNSGTNDANRISFVAEGDVVIEQGYVGPSAYNTVEGFEVRSYPSHGFYIRGSGVTLRRCKSIRNGGYGITTYTGGSTYYFLMENCVVARNSSGGIYPGNGSFYSSIFRHVTTAANTGYGLFPGGTGNRIENSISAFNTYGIYDNQPDILENNDVYGNTSWQYAGLTTHLSDVSVDPQFLDAGSDLFHLKPASPLIGQATDGRSIGALGVGYQSAVWAPGGWTGWTDGNGAAVGSAGAEIEFDINGHLKLRDDLTSAVTRSPVIDADLPGVAFITFDFDALEVTDLPAGSRQVVDYDPSTREREARFRVASTAAGITSAPWNVAVSGAPVGGPGRFIQIEYTLRRDGN